MIAIKTTMEYMPSDCDYCRWFGTRPHPYKGWTDICELMGHCMDDDQPEEWIYSGDGRPKMCPLVEIADRKTENSSEKPNNCEPQTYITEDRDTQILDAWQVHNGNTTSVKDEPQTYVINSQEPTNDDKCFDCEDFFTCDGQCDEVEDEPQIGEMMTEEEFDSMLARVLTGKDEPQTCEECEHWSDTEDGCADRHGCTMTERSSE